MPIMVSIDTLQPNVCSVGSNPISQKREHIVKKLALVAASSAVLLLSACAGTAPTVAEPEMPAPVQTANVLLVRSLVLPIDPSIKLEQAFAEFGACRPGTQEWAETDAGNVQFSCSYDDGTIIQFDFTVAGDKSVKLRQFTFTAMNDAEFAGVSLRGPDAEDALKNIYRNQPLF